MAAGLCVVMAAPLAGAKPADWITYHHDDQRTSDAVMAPGKTFTSLKPAWTWHIPQGVSAQTLYGEPLVAGGVVYVASNSNWVYALSASSGKLLWEQRVGPPEHSEGNGVCGDITPYLGIVSTPVIDLARQEIFVVAAIATDADHRTPTRTLFGLNLKTGAVELSRNVEPQPASPNSYLLQRVALAEVDNQIVIGYGGNDGDCGNYHGWLVSTAADNSSTGVHKYKVSSIAISGDTGGAIWMGGGAPTIDSSGNLLVASGNNDWGRDCPSGTGAAYDESDSVLSLSPTMSLLDYFEPSSFGYDNCHDLDLGSGAPQLLQSGLLLQIGKTHTGYLLHASNLGHAAAPAGSFTVCSGGQDNGAAAIISQTSTQSVLAVPCSSGLQKVTVSSSPTISGTVNWTSHSTGPPILAEGKLFAIQPSTSNATLAEIDPSSGTFVLQRFIGPVMNHFATPAAGDGLLVVAASGEVFAFRPTGP